MQNEELLLVQQELEAARSKYFELYNFAPVGYMTLDQDGRITDANLTLAEMLGLERRTLCSSGFSRFLDLENLAKFSRHREAVMTTRENLSCELRIDRPQGGPLYVLVESAPSEGQDGRIDGCRTTVTDLTELRNLESQLRQAQKMEALGTLAGGIAHDFNNILAIIAGFTELGLDDAVKGVVNVEAFKTIQMAGGRGKNLVRQILTFSRKAQPARARLNLNDRIAATIALLRQTLPKMIEINFQPAKDLPKIQADPGQIDQLIFNLCSNASDAMAGGGRLNIRTGLEDVFEGACSACGMDFSGEYVYIEAADTGHGMSRDVLSNIFDPFFTTKEVGKGTGLGLSTVFGIAKGHGGHITCTSQVGEGSVFRVFLPVSGQRMVLDPDIDNGQTENGPTAVGRGETILLVDDEKAILDVGVLTLKRAGYKVLTAQSGEEALEIREREAGQIDLVILDLSMPGMGGRECLKQLLKAEPKLKVIIASGYSLADRQAASLPPGALTFLPKPFTKSQLLNTISEVLHLDRSGNGTVG